MKKKIAQHKLSFTGLKSSDMNSLSKRFTRSFQVHYPFILITFVTQAGEIALIYTQICTEKSVLNL